MDGGSGCMFWLIIAIGILYAIVIAIFAVAACGSIYGSYKAMLCYATALKRTYGGDQNYEAGIAMKFLMALILAVLLFGVFMGFSYFGSDRIYR